MTTGDICRGIPWRLAKSQSRLARMPFVAKQRFVTILI
jgi:hypothetical protein